jgi:hypothetical protein
VQACEHAVAYQLFVGVDIAALTATIAWQAPKQKPSKPITIEQTPEGFSSLHHRLLKTGAQPDRMLVVMEATGIYWLALATFLARLGYAVSIVNPALEGMQRSEYSSLTLKFGEGERTQCSIPLSERQ